MTTMMAAVVAVVLAPLVTVYVALWIDRARGVEPDTHVFDALAQANRRLTVPAQRWWDPAVEALLAVGLTLRSTAHVTAAAAAGLTPTLAPTDLTIQNAVEPVRDLDGWTVDLSGRVLAACLGVFIWVGVGSVSVQMPQPWARMAVRGYIVANLAVLLLDPVAGVAAWYRSETQPSTTQSPKVTTDD